jgi:hypothetical protein
VGFKIWFDGYLNDIFNHRDFLSRHSIVRVSNARTSGSELYIDLVKQVHGLYAGGRL